MLLLQKAHQSKVGVGCIELEIDEFVEVSFSLRMEVLFHHGLHFYKRQKNNSLDKPITELQTDKSPALQQKTVQKKKKSFLPLLSRTANLANTLFTRPLK